jgi:hypothetical protein
MLGGRAGGRSELPLSVMDSIYRSSALILGDYKIVHGKVVQSITTR